MSEVDKLIKRTVDKMSSRHKMKLVKVFEGWEVWERHGGTFILYRITKGDSWYQVNKTQVGPEYSTIKEAEGAMY